MFSLVPTALWEGPGYVPRGQGTCTMLFTERKTVYAAHAQTVSTRPSPRFVGGAWVQVLATPLSYSMCMGCRASFGVSLSVILLNLTIWQFPCFRLQPCRERPWYQKKINALN